MRINVDNINIFISNFFLLIFPHLDLFFLFWKFLLPIYQKPFNFLWDQWKEYFSYHWEKLCSFSQSTCYQKMRIEISFNLIHISLYFVLQILIQTRFTDNRWVILRISKFWWYFFAFALVALRLWISKSVVMKKIIINNCEKIIVLNFQKKLLATYYEKNKFNKKRIYLSIFWRPTVGNIFFK